MDKKKNIPIYTAELEKIVANQARSKRLKYHVIPSVDEWIVVIGGEEIPFMAFPKKNDAVVFAKKRASSVNLGEVIIHGTNGNVLQRIAY